MCLQHKILFCVYAYIIPFAPGCTKIRVIKVTAIIQRILQWLIYNLPLLVLFVEFMLARTLKVSFAYLESAI